MFPVPWTTPAGLLSELASTHIDVSNSWEYFPLAATAAKSLQSCPTLCEPIDGSPPGSAVPGILQARFLEWVSISFSPDWKWKVKVKLLSRVQLSETPWTVVCQAPPSMGFSRQEYWISQARIFPGNYHCLLQFPLGTICNLMRDSRHFIEVHTHTCKV